MTLVKFTANLKRFYPELAPIRVDQKNIAGIIEEVERRHAGIRDYILNERGELRKHVHIFIGNEMIKDRQHLQDEVGTDDEVYIMQALSGG